MGLISKEYAEVVDKACCGSHIHTSFQIRMPYIKGMLHQVDFKDFLKRSGTQTIVDIWGKAHPVRSVDIILTRSQFKAYGWLRENGMTWEDYWDAFRDYNHALYITNLSKTEPEKLVELNYQFLSTLSIQPEEFRPADLPEGWGHSPEDDPRQWLTKATETAYYNFRANEAYQQEYFRRGLSQPKGKPGEHHGPGVGEEPEVYPRAYLRGTAGWAGPEDPPRLRRWAAAGARGQPFPLR